jgi:hypothetical protein
MTKIHLRRFGKELSVCGNSSINLTDFYEDVTCERCKSVIADELNLFCE